MKLLRYLGLALVVAALAACADLEVTNQNDPDRERAVATPGDVEALISGSFSNWWQGGHWNSIGIGMSAAADAHTASWGNFGMQDISSEPRVAFNNQSSYSYSYITDNHWTDNYRALTSIRDGLEALDGGVALIDGGEDNTHRARTFAAFVQGLALGHLALTFDQAFIVDETVTIEDTPQLQPWTDVLQVSLAKLDQAVSMAAEQSFTIPADWVGGVRDLSNTELAELAHGYKARFLISAPRDVAGRDAVDWQAVLAEVDQAHTEDFETVSTIDGDWRRDRLKVHGGGLEGWARIDLQMLGPAHAGSDWRDWLALEPGLRQPFLIDTDDRRITGGDPTSEGLYVRYLEGIPFRPERGTYHFSNYSDSRWFELHAVSPTYRGMNNGEFPVKELDFIRAEALFRIGDRAGAAAIINKYREANGELPPVTVNGVPQSDRCVPKTAAGACGDLWETLKYEKRIEVYHYGFGVEFFDDRGWGDLLTGTPLQFPVPGEELETLLMPLYTFGGGGESSAP